VLARLLALLGVGGGEVVDHSVRTIVRIVVPAVQLDEGVVVVVGLLNDGHAEKFLAKKLMFRMTYLWVKKFREVKKASAIVDLLGDCRFA
jgi:hypothetical protein